MSIFWRTSKATIDIETVNVIIKLLGEEILKYPADSKESIALMKFMQKLSDL